MDLKSNKTEQKMINLGGRTNIGWLRKGKVGGQFWSTFVRCFTQEKNAIRNVFQQIDLIKRIVKQYKDTFQFATSADEVIAAHESGKIASLIGKKDKLRKTYNKCQNMVYQTIDKNI